jgi:hypothetical protein
METSLGISTIFYKNVSTPCWRVVGIAPEAVNQRWQIEENAKGKISALCSDPSLTSEKRREGIGQTQRANEAGDRKDHPGEAA